MNILNGSNNFYRTCSKKSKFKFTKIGYAEHFTDFLRFFGCFRFVCNTTKNSREPIMKTQRSTPAGRCEYVCKDRNSFSHLCGRPRTKITAFEKINGYILQSVYRHLHYNRILSIIVSSHFFHNEIFYVKNVLKDVSVQNKHHTSYFIMFVAQLLINMFVPF